MAPSALGVDLGKTRCRAVLDGRLAEGAGSPGLASPGGAAGACAAVLAVAQPLLAGATVDAACVGAAGALAAPGAAAELARLLRAALPARAVAVTSDAVTSHAGALGGGPGVVLAVGTGAVALGAGPGVVHRVDGWGPWLGDEGSGASIGLHGLRAALRAWDGRGPATALEAAAGRLGPLADLAALVEGYANPPRLAAGFAPDVARAAAAGDAVAIAILSDATRALAAAVRAAAAPLARHGPVPVAVVGGLLSLGDPLTGPLFRALRTLPGVQLVQARGKAVDGALLLAREPGTVHEAGVERV